MAIESARWTREELERFPRDGNRYEVLDGELLVTPQAGFNHQAVAARLTSALYVYCSANGVGLTVGPGAVIWGKNELQPDIEVVPVVSPRPGDTWETVPYPILAVEVLSPSGASRRRDLDIKRKAYLRIGIDSYWVIDPAERQVHVWSRARQIETVVTDVLRWKPKRTVPAFELTIDQLFGPAPA